MNNKFAALPFRPTNILIPQGCDMERWSVVACDQYTAQPDYWQRVADTVGDAPSSLRLILPECQLEDGRTEKHIADIHATMEDYLKQSLFRLLPDSMVYVERWLASGKLRRGLVGAVDLEQYDYNTGSGSPIRPTEGTILSRIPPRLAVRRGAPLELPHVMLLADDPEQQVIEHLSAETGEMDLLYDFDLMENGGHITGWLLNERQLDEIAELLTQLAADAPGNPPLIFAVGDGNHSLATAKAAYEEAKGTERETLCRYALVELCNLHDESLEFEAIHRVCFGVDTTLLLRDLLATYPGAHLGKPTAEEQSFRYVTAEEENTISVPSSPCQLAVGTLQTFLDGWIPAHGGTVDYIHGEGVIRSLAVQPGNIGFLLPTMTKDELFPTVIHDGTLPRKTFSMGEANDKRFYLEARKI